uniref:Uncharacterized protein n=1 Tax=viral metagenome TaxID=1070528 RepID=A0A6C0IVR5_9ZZZZ
MEYLFDPLNPNDSTKFFPAPNPDLKLKRFAPMREQATYQDGIEWGYRWEEMICQINYQFQKLLELNQDIGFYVGCQKSGNDWKASTAQTADLIIVEKKTNYRKSLKELGCDDTQIRNTDCLLEHKQSFSPTSLISCISKLGSLGSYLTRNPDKIVYIIKTVVPGHFTLSLYYPSENRLEYFDSGGTEDTIFYKDGIPFSAELITQNKLSGRKKKCLEKEITDFNVCMSLTSIFNEAQFVSINTKDLQISDDDAYCQSWVLLYAYIRFVYPRYTTEATLEFLHTLSKSQLYNLIVCWWKYIIYLPTEQLKKKAYIGAYNSLFR